MGLQRENGEPEVEWREEDNSPQGGRKGATTRGDDLLQHEEWQCDQSQNKPQVEVEGQVLEVERPWLSAVQFGASAFGENVLLDNVP